MRSWRAVVSKSGKAAVEFYMLLFTSNGPHIIFVKWKKVEETVAFRVEKSWGKKPRDFHPMNILTTMTFPLQHPGHRLTEGGKDIIFP